MRELSIGIATDLHAPFRAAEQVLLHDAGRQIEARAGEVLYRQGDAAEHVFLLGSGRMKSEMTGADGTVSLLRLHLPGSLLGLTALGSAPRRDADAIALEDARLTSVPAPAFADLVAATPALARGVTRLLVDRMSDSHHRVGHLAPQDVAGRLAVTRLALSRPDPLGGDAPSTIRLTHAELASLIHARRPTVSAAIGRLVRAGLVARADTGLVVADRPGLERLSSV